MNLKLGRTKPTKSKLKLARYLGPALPPPPPSCDWTQAMTQDWGVMDNDNLGNCTCAAMGHAVQVITSNGDGLIVPSNSSVDEMYENSGYDPSQADPVTGSNPTDQGWDELSAMRFMVDHGLAGVRVDAFADVDHTNIEQMKQTISLMGGMYIGVLITQQDMDDFKNNVAWQDLNTDNVLGGHALWVVGYDDTGITVITWGKAQNATWEWVRAKMDEAHACIFLPWVKNSVNTSPGGFDQAQLEADLKVL